MSGLSVWGLAARPKTLPAALAPVVLGTALAASEGLWEPAAALFCLVFAVLVQIGTNYTNDYYDFVRGADTPDRDGPTRATAAGFIRPLAMRRAAFLVFGMAFLAGMPLVLYGGWWLVPIGLACIVSGISYTAGPWPLAYKGMGDFFVFVFFGIVAVTVTYYVQTGAFSIRAFTASLPIGALITNILVVNNQRDRRSDALAGKKTLAARFGETFSIAEYLGMLILAFGSPVVLRVSGEGASVLLPLILLPWAALLFRRFWRAESGGEYNSVLAGTALLGLAFSAMFAAGVLIG